jgi:hypothetical protein
MGGAGHKTIQMTTRYAHLSPGRLQSAVELISGAKGANLREQPPEKTNSHRYEKGHPEGVAIIS